MSYQTKPEILRETISDVPVAMLYQPNVVMLTIREESDLQTAIFAEIVKIHPFGFSGVMTEIRRMGLYFGY